MPKHQTKLCEPWPQAPADLRHKAPSTNVYLAQLALTLAQGSENNTVQDLARNLAQGSRNNTVQDLARNLAQDLAQGSGNSTVQDLARNLARNNTVPFRMLQKFGLAGQTSGRAGQTSAAAL